MTIMADCQEKAPVLPSRGSRIMLITGSLGGGGAERQFAYTIMGLCQMVSVEKVFALFADLTSPGADFYLPLLSGLEKCEVLQLQHQPDESEDNSLLASLRGSMPESIISRIKDYASTIARFQPDVVHCWQDSINVMGGLGAVIANVPRIVLSCRNVSPPHFALYQPFMWNAYHVLLEYPHVMLTANSHAGAIDYAAWLGISPDRVPVVRNALLPEEYSFPTPESTAALRDKLGVPQDAMVLGAIFRLSDEKRPLLWIEVALQVARQRPDLHVVLFGAGSLGAKVMAAVEASGIANRVHLAGHTSLVMHGLSLFNLFLLTSRQEGMPNVLLESQWMGVPVVAVRVGGVEEALVPGGGETFDDDSVPSLVNACIRALGAPRPSQDAMRHKLSTRYSWQGMIQATLALYSQQSTPPEALPNHQDLSLGSAITAYLQAQSEPLVFACPVPLLPEQLRKLRRTDVVVGVVTPHARALQREFGDWLGQYDTKKWVWSPPRTRANHILFMGPPGALSWKMVLQARRRGLKSITWLTGGGTPVQIGLLAFLVRAMLAERKSAMVWVNFLRRSIAAVRRLPGEYSQRLMRKIESRPRLRRLHDALGFAEKRRHRFAMALAIGASDSPRYSPIPHNVLLLSGSLGPGGAERQLVNTVRRIAPQIDGRVRLLVQQLSAGSIVNNFHLNEAQTADIGIEELQPQSCPSERLMLRRQLPEDVWRAVDMIPPPFSAQVETLLLHIIKMRPQVVHAWIDDPNLVAGTAALLAGVPTVLLSARSVAPHNFVLFKSIYRPLYQALLRYPQIQLLNNSEAGARDYSEWLDIPPERIVVLRNGVDFDNMIATPAEALAERTLAGIPHDAPVVGSIFRMTEEKRPYLWIKAAALAARRRPDVHFLLYGWGPLTERVIAYAKQLVPDGRIHIRPLIKRPALAMATMDIYMMTSRKEGLPNTLIEAQWMGLPVITTNCGGAPETIDPGRTGIVVAPATPPKLAEAICSILDNPGWREAAGKLAPDFVRQRFGIDRMAKETLDLYRLDTRRV